MWKPGEGWLVAALAAVLAVTAGISFSSEDAGRTVYRLDFNSGSMFISDAGESHGGFEFTADYKVTLAPSHGVVMYSGDEVTMELVLRIGLGDPLSAHEVDVRITYDPASDRICMTMVKTTFQLVHVFEDTVWDHEFDGHYIASWGGYAPEEEIRGLIGPTAFGLPDHYYIELRLDIVVVPVPS